MREIANAELTLADIPAPDADYVAIGEFALTFNGYKTWGSFDSAPKLQMPSGTIRSRT